jgi:hypothetical protein
MQLNLDADRHTHWQPCRKDVRNPDWGLGVISSSPLIHAVDTSSAELLPLLPGPYSTSSSSSSDQKSGTTNGSESNESKTSTTTASWPARWLNAHSVHIMLPNGRLLRIVNCHLHYKPYGPYIVMDAIKAKRTAGDTISNDDEVTMARAAVSESDHTQGADMDAIAYQLLNQPSPVSHVDTLPLPTTLVMGDFNLCSHLDWNGTTTTTTAVALTNPTETKVVSSTSKSTDGMPVCSPPRDYGLHCPVAWPVSTKLHAHGFEDTYR